MKFTQIAPVRWKTTRGREVQEGYTLFALGEDGQVYKSMPNSQGYPQHRGWLPLDDRPLPANFNSPRPNDPRPSVAAPSAVTRKIGIEWNNGMRSYSCSECGKSTEPCTHSNVGYFDVVPPWRPIAPEEILGASGNPEAYSKTVQVSDGAKVVASLAPGESVIVAQVAMCPEGCGHPVADHYQAEGDEVSGGCLHHVATPNGTLTAHDFNYCDCEWAPPPHPASVAAAVPVGPVGEGEDAAVTEVAVKQDPEDIPF